MKANRICAQIDGHSLKEGVCGGVEGVPGRRKCQDFKNNSVDFTPICG